MEPGCIHEKKTVLLKDSNFSLLHHLPFLWSKMQRARRLQKAEHDSPRADTVSPVQKLLYFFASAWVAQRHFKFTGTSRNPCWHHLSRSPFAVTSCSANSSSWAVGARIPVIPLHPSHSLVSRCPNYHLVLLTFCPQSILGQCIFLRLYRYSLPGVHLAEERAIVSGGRQHPSEPLQSLRAQGAAFS